MEDKRLQSESKTKSAFPNPRCALFNKDMGYKSRNIEKNNESNKNGKKGKKLDWKEKRDI